MRNDPTLVSWKVETGGPGEAALLKHWLAEQTDLGRMFVDEAISYPAGNKVTVATEQRVGDAFERISIDETATPGELIITFRRRPSDNGRWKDLMMRFIRALEAKHATVTLNRESLRPD